MKHIQKDYKVKIYLPRESANQNVVIVGEINDEDHTVLSVMQLLERLTNEEVDEMILETDVDETHCPQRLVDVPVPQIAERIVTFHGSESGNVSLHRSSTCHDTHAMWWRRSSKILNLPQQVANSQDAKIVSRHDPAVNSLELKQSKIIKNTVLSKNPIDPAQDQSGEQASGTRSRANTFDKLAVVPSVIQSQRSSRQCRTRSLDPTMIKEAKINQFDKLFEILEEQYIDKEIDVPGMLPSKVPTAKPVHREQWR